MNDESLDLDLNPLIDVTFQLLIFFMISINFRTIEGNLNSYLPKSRGMSSQKTTKKPMVEDVRIKLRYDRTKQKTRITLKTLGETEVSWENLGRELVQQYENVMEQQSGGEKPTIKIDAGSFVPMGDVVRVLDTSTKHILRNEKYEGAKLQYVGESDSLKDLMKDG